MTSKLLKMQHWFNGALGQRVLDIETAAVEQLLPGYFGYHLMQLSVQNKPLFEQSPIGHKFSLATHQDQLRGHSAVSLGEGLPLEENSMDVVLLHHLLDYHAKPQELLREVARVSRPSGHLLIVGFNPMSLWGGWQQVAKYRGQAPWQGSYIRPSRLMDWLTLLNFKIDRAQYCIYGPPTLRGVPAHDGQFDDGISRQINWPFGGVYVIVARKQVGSLIPMRPVWQTQRSFGQLNVVRTTAREEK